jgi:DNA-binding NarL/FixJ family response regulator
MTVSRAPATPPAVLVLGAHAGLRRAAALLGAAGFPVTGDAPPALVLVAGGATPTPVVEAAARSRPGAAIVALMPADADEALLRQALSAGADGIVLEPELARTLVPTVRAVLAGQLAVPQSMRRRFAPKAFSHRERQILALVVQGNTNRQIAQQLYLSESTVKSHLASSFRKLGARSRAEAAALVLDPEAGYSLGIPIAEDRRALERSIPVQSIEQGVKL